MESPRPPRATVGPYALQGVIAHGSAGVIYRALSPSGDGIALKVLHARLDAESDHVRFEREAGIRLEHPNVIEVLDAGVDDDGTPYIALELLDGEPLSARLARTLLTPREAVDVGTQVCRGLAAAHARGIVHRDLKPENLFLCTDGTVKILDFGIALVQARETRMTTTGIVLGTAWYLAPEQAQGERTLDARVDVWALGAVLYEGLVGRAPFEREGALATVLAIVREELEPLRQVAPQLPTSLAAAIERALHKDPGARWRSTETFRQALEELDLEEAEPRPASQRPSRPTIVPGEQRVVAVLLAERTRDAGALQGAVQAWGGSYLPLFGHRAVGLFGGSSSEGDELERAASAAMAARGTAEHLSIAAGRAAERGRSIAGDALSAAERGIEARIDGIAVDHEAARGLAERFRVQRAHGDLFQLVAKHPSPPPPRPGRFTEGHAVRGGEPPPDDELPPMLGRQAERAQMEDGLRSCAEDGHAVTVVVAGAPGIGKTRLRREMQGMLAESDAPFRVLEARADPLGRASALSLFGAALRRYARTAARERHASRIDPDAPIEDRQRAVRALAREALADESLAEETAPFLGELVGIPMPQRADLDAARSDAELMADRLRVALRDWFEGLCEHGPVALLVDNLQWADAASLELLEDLADRLADRPLLLFATTRPWLRESRPELFAGRDVVWIAPRGLGARDVAGLAERVAGRTVPDGVARMLVERTGGNPLFVEQIVLALQERGALDDEPDVEPLPVSVEAAIQSRLDHLPHLEKNLCKRAAILGRPFSIRELESLGVPDARALLDALRRRGFIAARAASHVGRGRAYRFRNPLIAEVAYNMLADDVRADLHRRAAAALAGTGTGGEEEIAIHHERGGEVSAAAARYAAATRTAARQGDSQTVLRCSERALELGTEERHELHMARAEALQFLGRFDEQARELERAIARAAGDVQRARAMAERIIGVWRQGHGADEALAAAQDAVELAEAAGDRRVQALTRGRQAVLRVFAGNLREARSSLETAEALAIDAGPWLRGLLAAYRAQLMGVQGDLGERRTAYGRAVQLCSEAGDIRRVANHTTNLADTLNRFGAYAEAEAALGDAIAKCRRTGHRMGEGYALANRGYARAMRGRSDDALEELAQARAVADATQAARLGVLVGCYRARARLARGDPGEDVAQEAEHTAREAQRIRQAGTRIVALALAAQAHLNAGQRKSALACSSEAFGALEELGGIEEDEADVYLAHAASLDAAGRHDEADAIRRQGRARILTLADDIGDEEWRRRFLEDVVAHRALVGLASRPGNNPPTIG